MIHLAKPFGLIVQDLELFAEREAMGVNALEQLARHSPSPLIDRALAESRSASETALALALMFRRWMPIEEQVRDVFAGLEVLRALPAEALRASA